MRTEIELSVKHELPGIDMIIGVDLGQPVQILSENNILINKDAPVFPQHLQDGDFLDDIVDLFGGEFFLTFAEVVD